MIKIQKLGKKYKKKVLDNVSFTIKCNEIVGLIGPNGAGKSTLMRIISGVNKSTEGNILFQKTKNGNILNFGVIFDYNGLYSQLTVRENILLFLQLQDNNIKNLTTETLHIIDQFGLTNVLDAKVKFFSKGMLRKVAVARVVATNPNILILDEPFDGLDIESHLFLIEYLTNWVSSGERSILISSHNMADIEKICTNIVILREGKVIEASSILSFHERAFKHVRISFSKYYQKEHIENIMSEINISSESFEYSNELLLKIDKDKISNIIMHLCSNKLQINEVVQEKDSMEKLYIRILEEKNDSFN